MTLFSTLLQVVRRHGSSTDASAETDVERRRALLRTVGTATLALSLPAMADTRSSVGKTASAAAPAAVGGNAQVTADTLATVTRIEQAQASGLKSYLTKAAMDGDHSQAEGTLAQVVNDPVAELNRTYRKSGSAGSGSWSPTLDRVTALKEDINRGRQFNVLDYFPSDGALVGQVQSGTLKQHDVIDRYVQAAVDDLNKSPSGGVLYFPRGHWLLSKQLWIKNGNSYITGDGMLATFLIFDDGDGSDAIQIASTAWVTKPSSKARIQYVGLEAMSISGRGGKNGYANRSGLKLSGCGFEGKLRDVELHGWGFNGMIAEDAWDWNVFGCKWTSNGNNQTATAPLPRAVSLRSSSDNTNAMKFIGCHWEGNTAGSIDISGRSNSIVFTNNKFERNGLGLDAHFEEISIDGSNSDGILFANNFVSRDKIPNYWMRIRGRGVIVVGNTLRGPTDAQGSLWFSVEPLGKGTRAVQARIFGNQIYAKGDLGKYPFNFQGLVKFHDNDVRIQNPSQAFFIASHGSEVRNNDVTQLGSAPQGSFLYAIADGTVSDVHGNTYSNEYATIGIEKSSFNDLNARLSSNLEFKRCGSANGSAISIDVDDFDTLGDGDGFAYTLDTTLTSLKRDQLGKRITIVVGPQGEVRAGKNLHLGAKSRRSGILTLLSIQMGARSGWQETSWVADFVA